MALTRPKIWDIDTNIEWFQDPITVLHQGATSANVDVGFLFNRANGLVSNVALYWNESSQSFVTAYTSSDGTTNTNIAVTSYANITTGNIVASAISVSGVDFTTNVVSLQSQIAGANAAIVTANTAMKAYVDAANTIQSSRIATLQGQVYANANVASYLPIYSGNIAAGNIVVPTQLTSNTALSNYGTLSVGGAINYGPDYGLAASFVSNIPGYNYVAVQNLSATGNASASFAAYNNTGSSYIDVGINSSAFNAVASGFVNNSLNTPNAGYVYTQNGDLVVGTYNNNGIHFITNAIQTVGDSMFIAGNGNVYISGNLTVSGNTTTINTITTIVTEQANSLQVSYISGNSGINSGLITISNPITVAGNATAGNVLATGFFYANGAPFVSSNFNPASPGTIGGTTPGAATFSSLKTTQTTVTLGASAGAISQGTYAISIGTYAGYNTQGAYSVVIGGQAGQNTAGAQSVLIGYNAGFNSSNGNVVAIGSYAGTQYQGQGAVAVGPNAGSNNQASNAIAIGNSAGVVQSASSIILNASGATLNDGGRAGFIVSAVRNDTGNVGNVVTYNTTTNEFTYSNTISIAGAATVGNVITTGGVFWANGSPYSSGGGGSGAINPALYLGKVTATTAPTLIDTLPFAGNNRISWRTTSYDSVNTQYRVSTIDSLNNGSTVYYNEYGVILSNVGTTVATFTSNITGSNINLYATGNSSSVAVTFERLVLGSTTNTGYLNVGPTGPTGPAGTVANISSSSGNVTITGNLYITSNTISGTTTRVEYNIPHPFMLMGAA